MNRVGDVLGGALGLLVASPALALAALGIKLEDRGPILYRQRRVGLRGEEFELLKLRTMVVGAEPKGAGYAVDRGDPRITRVGRLLRRLSLDELPQLWNVVRGEMSLVGPRPTLRYQVERYTERQRRRLDVKPGITGWAQVHGRAALPWEERIELDVWYVEHRTPLARPEDPRADAARALPRHLQGRDGRLGHEQRVEQAAPGLERLERPADAEPRVALEHARELARALLAHLDEQRRPVLPRACGPSRRRRRAPRPRRRS